MLRRTRRALDAFNGSRAARPVRGKSRDLPAQIGARARDKESRTLIATGQGDVTRSMRAEHKRLMRAIRNRKSLGELGFACGECAVRLPWDALGAGELATDLWLCGPCWQTAMQP